MRGVTQLEKTLKLGLAPEAVEIRYESVSSLRTIVWIGNTHLAGMGGFRLGTVFVAITLTVAAIFVIAASKLRFTHPEGMLGRGGRDEIWQDITVVE